MRELTVRQWSEGEAEGLITWIYTADGPKRVKAVRKSDDRPTVLGGACVVWGENIGDFGNVYCTWDHKLYVGLYETAVIDWRKRRAALDKSLRARSANI